PGPAGIADGPLVPAPAPTPPEQPARAQPRHTTTASRPAWAALRVFGIPSPCHSLNFGDREPASVGGLTLPLGPGAGWPVPATGAKQKERAVDVRMRDVPEQMVVTEQGMVDQTELEKWLPGAMARVHAAAGSAAATTADQPYLLRDGQPQGVFIVIYEGDPHE